MRTLSKSDYTLARTCDTKLHFREERYPTNDDASPYMRLLADGGYMVDALARTRWPSGILLEPLWDPVRDFEETRAYLASDTVTLFQATLFSGRREARVDVLEKRGNVVRLIEVKAKSFDGAEHSRSLAAGGQGVFRSKNKPHAHITDWLPKFEDLTFQVLLFERLFPGATVEPALMLVDKSKRASFDGVPQLFELVRRTHADGASRTYSAHFVGTLDQAAMLDVLTEVDATRDVADLRDSVEREASRFEGMLDAAFDRSLVVYGAKCGACEFRVPGPPEQSGFAQCWGTMANVSPHVLELSEIGKVKEADGTPVIQSLTRVGKASLFDIPESLLAKKDGTIGPQAERQLRQIRHARSREVWIGAELKARLEALQYPMHFIDFEVSRLALPYHANMRPYGQVAFQWSCHTLDAPGEAPRHMEWLNDADMWPNVAFARTLHEVIGDRDTVLAWSPYERGRLEELAREHPNFVARDPALEAWVEGLSKTRIFDLHKCAVNDFYHPDMGGKTSIKVVLDALWRSDAVMRRQFAEWTGLGVSPSDDPYRALPALEIDGVVQDVREGTGAIRAYQAMMYGVEKNDHGARAKWRSLLLQYCKLDTLSMVLVFEHWRRATGLAAEVP